MKLKFRHKVFLTFLLNSLVIVISMFLISRYYAFRNFEEYISKVEMQRLSELADALGQEYRRTRSWSPILDNLDRLLQVTGIEHGRFRGTAIPEERPYPPPSPPPPHSPGPHAGKHPQQGEAPPFGQLPPLPPVPPPSPEDMARHISLFDADKQPLTAGGPSSTEGYRLRPITVDGELVGWLGMKRPEHVIHPLDEEYLRVQSQTFSTIGGVAVLLGVLVAFVLPRHLLLPVKVLAEGTRALTSRRFETRIEVRSQDELGQLAADFNEMAQALERYEWMRRQWLADISHELRTPLAILRGEIEAMQDGVREVTREALDSLHFEVQHVSRIVHDLHDLSLIESPTSDAERTAVNPLEVLEETLKSFHTRFEHRDIRVEARCAGQVTIMADADRLKQLFSNLLENTLRYAQTPGVLWISHELIQDRLSLYFEDSGPGVPEESLGCLFDRLYRVDKARSRAQGGSGLGLAICKGIVESFGGEIEASNAPSGGLRIGIVFPVQPS